MSVGSETLGNLKLGRRRKESLAEIAIEELGIKTSQSVYREHRYKLSGFAQFFTSESVQVLKAGGTPTNGDIQLPKRIGLRMWEGYYTNVVLDFPNYRPKAEVHGKEGLKVKLRVKPLRVMAQYSQT